MDLVLTVNMGVMSPSDFGRFDVDDNVVIVYNDTQYNIKCHGYNHTFLLTPGHQQFYTVHDTKRGDVVGFSKIDRQCDMHCKFVSGDAPKGEWKFLANIDKRQIVLTRCEKKSK